MRGLCRPHGTSRPRGPSSRGRASPKQRFSARNRNANGTRPQSMAVLDAPRCPVGARGRAGLRCCHPHRARRAIARGDGAPPRARSSLRGRARCDGGIRRRSRRGPRCAGSGRCSPPRMSGMLSSPPRRGGGPLRESGAVHMSWATPVLSAEFPAVDYRFAFPSLPDHGGVTRERDKESALTAIMTRGLSFLSRWRRDMGGCPTGQHETRVVLPVTICHDS